VSRLPRLRQLRRSAHFTQLKVLANSSLGQPLQTGEKRVGERLHGPGNEMSCLAAVDALQDRIGEVLERLAKW